MNQHLILVGPPTKGHLHPLLGLADIFIRELGAVVSFVYPVPDEDPDPPYHTLDDSHVAFLPIVVRAEEGLLTCWKYPEIERASLIAKVDRHVAAACERGWPYPTCLILDQFSVWSLDLADHLGAIPAVLFVASSFPYLYMAMHREAILDHVDNPLSTHFKFPELLDLPNSRLPRVHGDRNYPPGQWFRQYFDRYSEVSGFVSQDLHVLAPAFINILKAEVSHRFQAPLFMIGSSSQVRNGAELPPPIDSFLVESAKSGTPVIYIAFGSWCLMPVEHLRAFTVALELSKVKFVWAYRPVSADRWYQFTAEKKNDFFPEQADTDFDCDGLPINFRNRIASQGLILPWIPQTEILRRPEIKLFVSHCGWNSLIEQFSCPVARPIIGVPLAAEQSINSDLVEHHWKIGLRVYEGGGLQDCQVPPPVPEQVASAIRTCLEDKEMRHRVETLARAVRDAAQNNPERREFLQYITTLSKGVDVLDQCP